jgi:hypothetical protein
MGPSLAQALLALPALVIAASARDITGPQCGPVFCAAKREMTEGVL